MKNWNPIFVCATFQDINSDKIAELLDLILEYKRDLNNILKKKAGFPDPVWTSTS